MGTSDGSNTSTPALQLGNEAIAGGGTEHLAIEFRINLAAVGIFYTLQTSADLSDWDAANLIHLSTTNNGDGTATLKYQSTTPTNELSGKNFYRIQITGTL